MITELAGFAGSLFGGGGSSGAPMAPVSANPTSGAKTYNVTYGAKGGTNWGLVALIVAGAVGITLLIVRILRK